MSTDASSVEKHPGHASAAVVDDEMELARMGYKQELKCVSSLHLFQRAFSPCILPPQARPHAPPGKFCLPSFPLFSIRYTLCKNVAFSGAFMTHTHLLDARVSLFPSLPATFSFGGRRTLSALVNRSTMGRAQ